MLVVGGREHSERLLERLSAEGYFCAAAGDPSQLREVSSELRPEAVLLSMTAAKAEAALALIQEVEELKGLPVLLDASRGRSELLRKLPVDDLVRSLDDLPRRLEQAVRAKRLVDRDVQARARMEALLEITQAASSSLELEQVLAIAVDKIGKALGAERCSVILVEGEGPRTASVVATREEPSANEATGTIHVDLVRYPELRRALETRQPVHIEDVQRDPLMSEVKGQLPEDVRALLVQPLVCHDDLLGALFLRLTRPDQVFSREERDFAQAVAGALSNSIRNARLHSALRKKREELESAYVDRYRELSEANRRLKEVNRLKDDIISLVSHDLRAPLQVLLGHARLMDEGDLDPEQKVSVDAISRVGRKVLDLVENLLEKGKGDVTRIALDPCPVDVALAARETVVELAILGAERGIRVSAQAPDELVVIGDSVKLRQVLQNLVTNAVRHARGAVTAHAQRLARPDGDVARVVVKDDGPGISGDQLHLVFDKFRHGGSGTGIGLTICKEFVELHGGEIWAQAPAEGGCEFVFTLPLAQAVSTAPREKALPSGEQPRVLVIEDEVQLAGQLSELLRTRYRVELARDGAEGLARARAQHPDLVVMDVFLPKLDGLDAVRALKGSSDTADIPVILLSAHEEIADKVRRLNLGAVDYLSRPFHSFDLLNRVESALRLRSAEREIERSRLLLRKAGSDAETGLLDRAGFTSRFEQELARSRRYGRSLAFAALLPSRHPAQRLRHAASLFRQSFRGADALGHVGDGCFVVLLPESSRETARTSLDRATSLVLDATGVTYVHKVIDAAPATGDAERLLRELVE